MNNNKDDEMLEQLKLNIAAYKFKEEEKQKINTLENKEKRGAFYMKKKIIATACACLVLVSGIVAAKAIKKSKNSDRGLGNGVDTAVDNGYIANPEMNFINFDDEGTEIKIENFVMDDLNLSVKFSLKFAESIESVVDLKKVYDIELNDLIVRDEENRIIFDGNSIEAFEKYCKENNLDYKYGECNENYMNCGLNWFIEEKNENIITLMYNIHSDKFPKSKKLYFSFKTITLHTLPLEQPIKYELEGAWEVEVDVPEKMYNRTTEYYKVISCDNKEFDIYNAIATDTGFEIGVIMPTDNKDESIINRTASYIEIENGDRFNFSLSLSRKAKNDFLEENKYDFYETFSMTKYDATDKLKIVLNYYGKPVTIELEKVK